MRFHTAFTVSVVLLALAFVSAFGAWIAVVMRHAEFFVPLTWAATILVAPAAVGLIAATALHMVSRLGIAWSIAAIAGAAASSMILGAGPTMGALAVLFMVWLPAEAYPISPARRRN